MKLTTEQVLELLSDCLSEWNEDDGLIATMLSQLCPFWDGPTFGLETPKVKVWSYHDGCDGQPDCRKHPPDSGVAPSPLNA
jgi:hypothetical protein